MSNIPIFTITQLRGSALITEEYDYILLDPPEKPTTIIYKKGGASGKTVATLTIVYSGGDMVSITKT